MSTPTTEQRMQLASDFPSVGRDEWVELAAKVLNKSRPEDKHLDRADVLARLRTELPGGLTTEALYVPGAEPVAGGYPGSMPFTRGIGPVSRDQPWDVRQLFEDPDPAAAHEAVMTDLEHGVTSLWFTLGEAGLAPADLPAALSDVLLDLAPIAVNGSEDQLAAATSLVDVWRAGPIELAQARGNLGLDPIGFAARHGGAPDLAVLDAVPGFARELSGVRPLIVDARVYHEAGGTIVDQLGAAVATGIGYLRGLEAAGIPAADSFGLIEFRVAVTDDQFLTIAALRALRRLWAVVGEKCGVPATARGAQMHAVTAWRMITRDDPFVNILRGTLACFGAAAGGAQSITTLPFDAAAGLPDRMSRRIARNTQVVLAEESHVSAVVDPAGGSWYVEDLTEQVARQSWSWVQELEAADGIAAALASGLIADRLAAGREADDIALASRKHPLTGVSMFPPLSEEPLRRKAYPAGASSGGLARRRDAELFEALRDRSAAMAAQGAPPSVLLATLGSQREFGARQTFTASLLAIAGISAISSNATTPEELAAEAADRPLVVLCSSAKGYAEHGEASIAALRGAGVSQIWVAGRARELPDGVVRDHPGRSSAGDELSVDGELYDGVDVVALLTHVLDTVEANR